MSSQADRAERFKALHEGPAAPADPQPVGSGARRSCSPRSASRRWRRRAAASAATLGRLDGSMTREEAHRQRRRDRRGDRPAGLRRSRERLRRRSGRGRRDDAAGDRGRPRRGLDRGLHAARGRADLRHRPRRANGSPPRPRPRTPARRGWSSRPGPRTTSTAVTDLADTIARLQAYQEAGADVLYAPGLSRLEDIRAARRLGRPARQRPGRPGAPSVTELAAAGVAGSRSAAPSLSRRSARWSKPPASCSTRGPTATSSKLVSVCRPRAPPSRKRLTSRPKR